MCFIKYYDKMNNISNISNISNNPHNGNNNNIHMSVQQNNTTPILTQLLLLNIIVQIYIPNSTIFITNCYSDGIVNINDNKIRSFGFSPQLNTRCNLELVINHIYYNTNIQTYKDIWGNEWYGMNQINGVRIVITIRDLITYYILMNE